MIVTGKRRSRDFPGTESPGSCRFFIADIIYLRLAKNLKNEKTNKPCSYLLGVETIPSSSPGSCPLSALVLVSTIGLRLKTWIRRARVRSALSTLPPLPCDDWSQEHAQCELLARNPMGRSLRIIDRSSTTLVRSWSNASTFSSKRSTMAGEVSVTKLSAS